MKIMKKLMLLVLTVIIFSSSSISLEAKNKKTAEEPKLLFEETITIDNETTKFEIGFVRVDFKKNFIEEDLYPMTFDVKLYAEDGQVYIEFAPDVEAFFKDVTIHVKAFDGYIYDVAEGDFIYVEIPNFVFKVPHFSRWCFVW